MYTDPDYTQIDEAAAPLHAVTDALLAFAGQVRDAEDVVAWSVEEMELETPLELEVHVQPDGTVVLGSTPPSVTTDVSWAPVFHTLKVTFAQEDGLLDT